jgi:hypothetical protein
VESRHAAVEVARASRGHPKMPASPTSGDHIATPSRISALPRHLIGERDDSHTQEVPPRDHSR